MKRLLALLLVMAASPCWAGIRDVGNGGIGLYIGKELYLLDLVEAGVHTNPVVDDWGEPSVATVERVKAAIPFLRPATLNLLARKLGEIERKDPIMGRLMLRAMEMFKWRLIAGPIPRHGRSFELDQPTVPSRFRDLVLIAERLRQAVRISLPFWRLLDPANQTGLVIHEITYAIMPTLMFLRPDGSQEVGTPRMQIAANARYVVGVFFHPLGYSKARMDLLSVFPLRPEPGPNLNYSSIENMIYFSGGGTPTRERAFCDRRMKELFACPPPEQELVNMNPAGVYDMSLVSFGERYGPSSYVRSWYVRVVLDAL